MTDVKMLVFFSCFFCFSGVPAHSQSPLIFKISPGGRQGQPVFPISAAAAPKAAFNLMPSEKSESAPPYVEDPERIVIAEARLLAPDEMQELRGGFIDPTGLIYKFAVNVQTALNGAEIFTRTITVSPTFDKHLQATTETALNSSNIPNNFNVLVLREGQGVSISNEDGGHSIVLNQTPGGPPISAILNTMNDSTIKQSVNMSLTINEMTPIMNSLRTSIGAALEQNSALRSVGLR